MSSPGEVVRLDQVSLCYRLAQQRIPSIKEFAIHWMKGALQYRQLWALREVSLSVSRGEQLSVIGRNGAGKSSLLKVISGVLQPTRGRIDRVGTVAPILELGTGFDYELTGVENIYLNALLLGHPRREIDAKLSSIVEFSGLHDFVRSPIRNYSSGMLARLGFSIATAWTPDLLILDEVLSVGDAWFVRQSRQRIAELRRQGAAILLVSHDLKAVVEQSDRCIWLEGGAIQGEGAPSEVVARYRAAVGATESVTTVGGDRPDDDGAPPAAPGAPSPTPPPDATAAPPDAPAAAPEPPARRASLLGTWRPAPLRRLGRRDVGCAVVAGLLAWLVYNANLRSIAAGDSFPARFLPFAILGEGTLRLDPVLDAVVGGHANPYWILPDRHGGSSSFYPIVTPVLVTPLYLPAFLYLESIEWEPERMAAVGLVMEKLAASTVAATAAALLFLAVRRRVGTGQSLVLFAAFAFGTNTWVVSSQALWQHGTAQLLLSLALLTMTGPPSRWRLLLAGLACGLVVGNRPPDIFLAAAFAAYAPFWAGLRSIVFYAAAAVPALLVLAYNLTSFGLIGGGYGVIASAESLGFPVARGLAGLLFSPAKGLFVFCPFLVFLPLFVHRAWAPPATRLLTVCLLAGVVAQLLFYSRVDWRGGMSHGPRFLTDMMPLLVWLLAPVLASLRRALRVAFLATGLVAVAIHAVGAFCYRGSSDVVRGDDWAALWALRSAPYVTDARQGVVPMTFLHLAGLRPEQTSHGYWLRRGGLR